MRKIKLAFTGLLSLMQAVTALAQSPQLDGYTYGQLDAPSGKEWESPEHHAHNKERPRALFHSFENIEAARKILPENSKYWQSLDGSWKFSWVKHPDERNTSFQKPEYDVSGWDDITVPSNWNIEGLKDGQKYGTPIYVNQKVIFQHSVKEDDWRGGVMREPAKDWTTYEARNEVGSYRRSFEIPADWDGREIYVNFEGVDSFFYLWINGKYVGFSKNSRNVAIFNISPYIKKGKNVIAAEVYRNSDASFLEAQDMFRLPGIYRSVSLFAKPKVQVRDLEVITDLDENYTDATLNISADIAVLASKSAKGHSISYRLYENRLYSDQNSLIPESSKEVPLGKLAKESEHNFKTQLVVPNAKLWSAERPQRYTLVAELIDKKGQVLEAVSTIVGIRKVEIKDTAAEDDEFGLAGRYYYINGKPVKLKGVNRHETIPQSGHTLTRDQMEAEIMLMKRANINHVRNSHYPTNSYWYYLCDKYGIYLEDEANIESHEYYYGKASLSHPKEWKNAHIARVLEMVHQNKNHASIVIWSLGNEAGPGQNFVDAYNALKKADQSRPVQYERNNRIVDMGSNQYPSIAWVNKAVTGEMNIKYPFHISEYAHSMGNAVGNLVDYWKAIESSNFFCGGAIWDWVDQALYHTNPKTGEQYLAYGGDFGDTPNDGQFVMNGIIFADRSPKPQYYEVKKVYQNIGVSTEDVASGKFEVFNKNYFKSLDAYGVRWELQENGKTVKDGYSNLGKIPARQSRTLQIDYGYEQLKADAEYHITIQFVQKGSQPWASSGYVQAEEQFLVKSAQDTPSLATINQGKKLKVDKSDSKGVVISGTDFRLQFNAATGSIHSLNYEGNEVFAEGKGPQLDAFRAFVNNDNWAYQAWFEHGLHNLTHTALEAKLIKNDNGSISMAFTVKSQAPQGAKILGGTSSGKNKVVELTEQPFTDEDFHFITNQIYTVYADGSVELQASISSNLESVVLPRLGYVMEVPQHFNKLSYYGRGPVGNYNDRKTGSFVGEYHTTVAQEFVAFPKPQDMANHEEVRWCALKDAQNSGAQFIATQGMSMSALPYRALDLTLAGHPHDLPAAGNTVLHLDAMVTGLGGNSCGQGGPLSHDRTYATQRNFGFIIRPASLSPQVSASGRMPISISRGKNGFMRISSNAVNTPIMYSINGSKAQKYVGSVVLQEGGKVSAWYQKDKASKVAHSFAKMDKIATQVIFASSEEPGSGDAAQNLVDGDFNSIWHTMYSVTVAQFPHWVDFDCGQVQRIKGFSYTPRKNGSNGDIKDYKIQVSLDNKNWTTVIGQGTFSANKKTKKVLFEKPVEAKYLRFTALSSQNGQDFASGSEFSILGE